ncbi:MAG: nucleotide exchange factor GrpE [Bacteroidota bacterium]|nr:nucleotide exchange factor GrpE [Bacteroidota bacterium]
MENKENTAEQNNQNISDGENIENTTDNSTENAITSDENSSSANNTESQNNELKIAELNDKYLRLYSEFDNYRKRTIKEKSDIIKTASEDVLKAILPIIDDFERAIKANEKVEDISAVKEGISLIYNKLKHITQQKGLVALDSIGQTFDADLMEAITHIPAQDESQKNKVIDEAEKGYKLGDKVIRFAKVIIAQ